MTDEQLQRATSIYTENFKKQAVKGAINVAKNNKEAIKKAAYDNKEVIAQVAYDNRDVIAKSAIDNKELLAESYIRK